MLVFTSHHILAVGDSARHQSVLVVFHYQNRPENGFCKRGGGCEE